MFLILAMIGLIASIFLFFAIIGTSSAELIPSFISMLISTAICFKLANMDKKIKYNEGEIAKLKTHLGIKNGDRVNNIPDNPEIDDENSDIEYVDYEGDISDFDISKNDENKDE